MSLHSQASVMDRLESLLDLFDSIPREAVALYQTYPPKVLIEHSTRAAATCIYDHMVAAADRKFLDRDDIKVLTIQGLRLWLIGKDQHTVIRWKKMDEDGRSRNYQTKQAEDFDKQMELTGLPPKPTRITVGYLQEGTGTGVSRVQLSRPNGRNVDWCAAIVPKDKRVDGAKIWVDITNQSRLSGT
jgi:hypothetical protein